ncbi:MlaD family protein [Tsukamurella soli]|uniref:MlaD family protein n=1 Tax=Tsukamurella soli TaxID=644556 RepID=A0ABP8K8E6_9ACTN
MKKSASFSLAMFLIVIVGGLLYIAGPLLHYDPFRRFVSVSMVLRNTDQVVPGTSVLLRGVKVGEVGDIDQVSGGVRARLRIDSAYEIPAITAVKIEQLSAVGEPYIDFLPDSLAGPYLSNGQTIDTAQVSTPLAIPEVFQRIAGFSGGIDSKALGGVATTVWQATRNTDAALPNLSTAGQLLSEMLAARMPGLRRMFANTQRYQSDMEWLPQALAQFGPSAAKPLDALAKLFPRLDQVMREADLPYQVTRTINPYLGRLPTYTNRLLPDLGAIVGPLAPVARAIDGVLPQLDVSELLVQALNTFGSGGVNLTVTVPTR